MRVQIVIPAIATCIFFSYIKIADVNANETADRCLAAIKKVKSYDVLLRLDIVDAAAIGVAHKDEDKILSTSLWRDVFAVGLGRRVEDSWKDPAHQGISVKTWDAALSSNESLATGLMKLGPADYFIYYNPVFFNVAKRNSITFMFLDELLADKSVTVEDIDASKALKIASMPLAGDVRGIRISSSKLLGPVHVWLDPKNGFMPCRVEEFVRPMSPRHVMCVDRFKKIGPDVWVPLAAKSAAVSVEGDDMPSRVVGPNDKVVPTGAIQAITVDESASSWNSVHDGTKFDVSSLPALNHEESGWKEYCGPERLPAVKAADAARQTIADAIADVKPKANVFRIILIGLNVAAILAIAVFILYRRLRHTPVRGSTA